MEKTNNKLSADSPLSFGFVVGATSLGFVVSQLDVSIVNIALPQISKSFSTGMSSLQWIVDAYTIAFAALMLSAGGMSDLLGSKKIFQIGLIVFAIASMGCGISWDPISLILFRVLQGFGSAIMIPSSLSILNQNYIHDPKQRARAVGFWTAAGGVSIAAGPVLGGLLIHLTTWRMIFFVNVPLCLLGVLLSTKLKGSQRQHGKGFDIPGQLVWMLALVALIGAIIEWHDFGIKHPLIYGSLIFSVVMFLWFIRIEKNAQFPILPLNLFKSSNFNVLVLMGTVLNNTYYGTVFILSLYLQNVLHYSVMNAGLAFLPLTAGFIISNILSGRLIGKHGIRVPILTGLTIVIFGFACLFIAKADTPYWELFIPFLAIPMGIGLAVPAMTTGVLASVDKSLSGTASAVLNTSRQASGAMGVAIFGAIANGGAIAILHAVRMSALISPVAILCCAVLIFKYLKSH